MNSMTRTFGKFMHRSPGDNARVSVLLKDYEDVDKLLAKLVEEARSLRDAWHGMVMAQLGAASEYVTLYDPIVGASDGHGRRAESTPEPLLIRSFNLRQAYADIKDDMVAELSAFEAGVVKPGSDARDAIQPIRRTIKKRENKRLDYEKQQEKVKKLQRKPGKSAKEDAQMHKAEEDLDRLSEEFTIVDTHLRESLPPVIEASFRIVPPLLATIISIQNRLLGLAYTAVHHYCLENNFQSPSPPMDMVISDWETRFRPIQKEIESLAIIRSGRVILQPMRVGDERSRNAPVSATKGDTRNGVTRSTPGAIPAGGPPRPRLIPHSPSGYHGPPRQRSPAPASTVVGSGVATDFTVATGLSDSSAVSSPGPRAAADYFGHATARTSSTIANVAARKKPPPPPPPKKVTLVEEFVVALYDFPGQGSDDLSFREGDLIKVIKKTKTDQDWWVGELGGVRGSFPANYCKPT